MMERRLGKQLRVGGPTGQSIVDGDISSFGYLAEPASVF
jgi:hypothetical protein